MAAWPGSVHPVRHTTLARRVQFGIGLIVALVIACVTAISYQQTVRSMRDEALEHLRVATRSRVVYESGAFVDAQSNTFALRDEYLRRLRDMGDEDPAAEFDAWFTRYPDGLIRVRSERDDHKRQPTIYIRAEAAVGVEQRRHVVAAFRLLREWGPAMTMRYYSAYIDLPGISLIMYSPSVNWGKEADRSTNNFDYPPVQNSAPDKNPLRKNLWTDVYFDDKANIWMLSTVTPVDQGRWIGTVSQDIAVDQLIRRTTNDSAPGTYNLIMDGSGRLVAHPGLMEKIQKSAGNLDIKSLRDPLIQGIFEVASRAGAGVAQSPDGEYYLGLGRIEGPNWHFVTVYPKTLVEAKAFEAARFILVVGVAGLLVALALLAWIIRKQVATPLKQLNEAAQSIADGQMNLALDESSQDELGQLARNFMHMTAKVRERELALQTLNQELDDRVQRRTQALEKANSELSDAVSTLRHAQNELVQAEKLAALGSLVAGVAHELNTPIGNAMVVASAMHHQAQNFEGLVTRNELKRSSLQRFLAESLEGSELLQRSLRRVADLVHSFKQVAVDQTSERQRVFGLNQMVGEIIATLKPNLSKLPWRVAVNISDDIELDSFPGPLGQVVINLVMNAATHAFEGRTDGSITVSGRMIGEDSVEIVVSDDGNGITPAIVGRIFEPFFTTRMGLGGSGLGLAIVHQLVTQILRGTVRVESVAGAGSRFIVRLARTIQRTGD